MKTKHTPLNPDFKHTLYTVAKCKSDKTSDTFKTAHGSQDAETTLCGKDIDWHWFITNNSFDGEITCKECLKKFEKVKPKSVVLKSGPFKGKRVELASTTSIDEVAMVAEDFMKKIFKMEPGDYLITDESRISDFAHDLIAVTKKVKKLYDIDVNEVEKGNLYQIFKKIAETEIL